MGLYRGLFLKIGDVGFWDVGECYFCVSILEVAVDPSYSNFFLEALQKRLILMPAFEAYCNWLHNDSASSSTLEPS
jgi:hypothetical protein